MNDINNIIQNDLKVKKLWEECKKYGVEVDVNKRWEQGLEHHPEAEKIFKLIKDSDWAFGGDYFCWKNGGDGDNGEWLMYTISVMLELIDKRNKHKERRNMEIIIGDIVQITNSKHHWFPSLIIVDEVKGFGILGYMHIPDKSNSPAYIRLNTEDFEYVGKAAILIGESIKKKG